MTRNPDRETTFRFKQFSVANNKSSMKVGTDSVLLGAWAAVDGVGRALDAGCGTGLLALMLAQRGVGEIDAVEIDAIAADEARSNVAASPWAEAIRVVEGDCTAWDGGSYNLIISNPPYFNSTTHSPDERRATARHESSLTFASLMAMAGRLLTAEGCMAFVSPADRSDDILFSATMAKLNLRRRCDVRSSARREPKRVLWEFTKLPCRPFIETLTLTDSDGSRSTDYKQLTKEFYL